MSELGYAQRGGGGHRTPELRSVVGVVAAQPRHRPLESILGAALGCEVYELLGAVDGVEASGGPLLARADDRCVHGVRPRKATSASVDDAPEGTSTSGAKRPARISGKIVARLASIAAAATSSGKVTG